MHTGGVAAQLTLDGSEVVIERRRSPYDADWQRTRAFVLERDQHTCRWCGGQADTVDHVQALADGGSRLDPANLVAACKTCNSRRGAERTNARRAGTITSRRWL